MKANPAQTVLFQQLWKACRHGIRLEQISHCIHKYIAKVFLIIAVAADFLVVCRFAPQGDFYTTTLEAEKMPSGKTMYQNMIKKQNADVIEPAKLSSFDLLLEYLKLPDFENANDEFDFLLREVKKLKENGVSLTDICVVARTKKLVDDYIALFTRAGIRSYAIKRNKVDDRSFDGLRVATMHRVKGLEFKYVFIAAVNNRIIPMPSAINKTDVVSEAESITSEKCLLYVAMTRAQKGVYITSYGRPSEFLG